MAPEVRFVKAAAMLKPRCHLVVLSNTGWPMRRCGSMKYSPGFDPDRFTAHEQFFVEDVRRWVRSLFGVELPAERTAVFGVSAIGELALAIELRHSEVYGAIWCASPALGTDRLT